MTHNIRLAALAFMLACLMLTPGCAFVSPSDVEGVRAKATEDLQAINDTAAQGLVDSTCAMTLGAYGRMEAGDEKHGACLICLPNDRCPTGKGE